MCKYVATMTTTMIETTDRIELSESAVEAIADQLAERDQPTAADARGFAYDLVERQTEFVTSDGRPLVEALESA